MDGLHVTQQTFLIPKPLLHQRRGWWVLATAQFKGDLEGVGMDIVEILHTPWDIVPVSSISDATGKIVAASSTSFHYRIIISINASDFLEKSVIGSSRVKSTAMMLGIILEAETKLVNIGLPCKCQVTDKRI